MQIGITRLILQDMLKAVSSLFGTIKAAHGNDVIVVSVQILNILGERPLGVALQETVIGGCMKSGEHRHSSAHQRLNFVRLVHWQTALGMRGNTKHRRWAETNLQEPAAQGCFWATVMQYAAA
jgi:hypothetical protein